MHNADKPRLFLMFCLLIILHMLLQINGQFTKYPTTDFEKKDVLEELKDHYFYMDVFMTSYPSSEALG